MHNREKTHRENLYKLVDLSPAFLGPDEGEDTTGALCSEVHGDGSPTQAVHAVTAQQRGGTDSGQASHRGQREDHRSPTHHPFRGGNVL